MAVITYQNLHVSCRMEIKNIQHFEYGIGDNSHIYAQIEGQAEEKSVEALLGDMDGEYIAIKEIDDKMGEAPIFSGLITEVRFKEPGGSNRIMVRAVSSTWKMDIEKKCRSFQDTRLTYKSLINSILAEYGDADMVFSVTDRPVAGPLIQYRETDWEFIGRIMSCLGVAVTADCRTKKPLFFCGYFCGGKEWTVDQSLYSIHFNRNYYFKTAAPLFDKSQYVYYEMAGTERYQLGDTVVIDGRRLTVCGKSGQVVQGILVFQYRLANQTYVETERYDNPLLSGLSLTGKVLAVKQERLKLHLDIDAKQDQEGAYFFPWRPLTGNLLYVMPEAGERVRLYLQDGREENAIGIDVIRKENGRGNALPDAARRSFITADNKNLHMYPDEIGIQATGGQGGNSALKLGDTHGIVLTATKAVSVIAERQFIIRGKRMEIKSAKEATMVRKDFISPTVVNLCNAFDIIGMAGGIKSVAEASPAVPDPVGQPAAPEEVRYDVGTAIFPVLCSIPADRAVPEAVGDVLGSIPVI